MPTSQGLDMVLVYKNRYLGVFCSQPFNEQTHSCPINAMFQSCILLSCI
jgi:hypothetical protein